MSNSPKTPTQPKYRPYLTETDIRHILSLAKADSPLSQNSKNLIKNLAPFLSKIENDVIAHAYEAVEKVTIEDSLGMVTKPIETLIDNISVSRKLAYEKQSIQGKDSCTIEELDLAYEYRAQNNLLTPEELAKEKDSWDNIDMSKYTNIEDTGDKS